MKPLKTKKNVRATTSNGGKAPQRTAAPKGSSAIRNTGPSRSRNPQWNLRLYVAAQTPASMDAMANLQQICEEHLGGRYRIEVIDLLKNPQLAAGDQIIAVPTLVRKLPTPVKRIIGDLSNRERVLIGLDLRPAGRVVRR